MGRGRVLSCRAVCRAVVFLVLQKSLLRGLQPGYLGVNPTLRIPPWMAEEAGQGRLLKLKFEIPQINRCLGTSECPETLVPLEGVWQPHPWQDQPPSVSRVEPLSAGAEISCRRKM